MDDAGGQAEGRGGTARLQQHLAELEQQIERVQQLIVASLNHGGASLDLEQALLLLLEARAVCEHGLGLLQGAPQKG